MDKDYKIFQKHFPPLAVDYCYKLWKDLSFKFKITKPRDTKLGDYSFRTSRGHTITVNNNLNQYSFLITYIHEVAHLITFQAHGNKPLPHGKEWKSNFYTTFKPLLNNTIIPEALLLVLINYLKNPKASSLGDSALVQALRIYDIKDEHSTEEATIELKQLPVGNHFILGNRLFCKGELRRTRYLCTDISSKKKYLIASLALVKKA